MNINISEQSRARQQAIAIQSNPLANAHTMGLRTVHAQSARTFAQFRIVLRTFAHLPAKSRKASRTFANLRKPSQAFDLRSSIFDFRFPIK